MIKMKKINTKTLLSAVSLCAAATTGFADEKAASSNPNGALFKSVFGDALEKNHGIAVLGWADASVVSSSSTASGALGNGAFFTQTDGARLNQLGLMVCKGGGCPPFALGPQHNVLPRIGPFPGPRTEGVELGFNVTAVYGQDAQFFRTAGYDDFTFDSGDSNKLAIPQAFVDISLPLFEGASLMVGNFFTNASGLEIGLPFNPPNWFATHTYGLQHGPALHRGALFSAKLPTAPGKGHLGFELGVVAGWNNAKEARPTAIGALRWRSPDLRTWVDFEAIYGDGQGDAFGPAAGGSPYVAISSTGAKLNRLNSSITVTHVVNDRLNIAGEIDYGFQKGGDVAVPGSITSDSKWYGANIAARYKLRDDLHLSGRAEWFRDENAANILWASNGATGGDVYSLTAGLEWQATPAMRLRGELRHDKYTGGGTLFAGGNNEQTTALMNAVFSF